MTHSHSRPKLKGGLGLAILLALALATLVVGVTGLKDVAAALDSLGWRGLWVLSLYSPVPLFFLGAGWWVIAGDPDGQKLHVFMWARLVRDAACELLPFSHLGGFIIGARAAVLGGVANRTAVSTTVADVTAELIAQLGFTGLGLVLLVSRLGLGGSHQALVGAVVGGLSLSAVGAVVFVLLQRRGGRLVERLAARLTPSATASAADFGRAIAEVYERPWRIAVAVALHALAWIASGVGVWLALRAGGVGLGLESVLGLESLVAAARSTLVFAPMGLGVQEAAYALMGPLFGLSPELALALSIIKRARDLAVGAPGLIAWQTAEGLRVMSRRPPRTAGRASAQG
jgi:putative membrane protein